MKRIFILLVVAGIAASARADLVLEQQITAQGPGGANSGVTTMKIKGNRVRMDLNAGQPQAQSTIIDLNTGESVTLLHSQKLFLRQAGSPAKSRPPGATSRAPVPRATGKTQKVGDYDTELYTWSNNRGINGTAWVARQFPDYARIRADLAVLDKSNGLDDDTAPELSMLPGMVVRSQVAAGGQSLTLALISARETTLDSAAFGIPRDYREVPKVKPLKPVVTQSPPPPAPRSQPTAAQPKSSGQPRQPAGGTGTASNANNPKAPPGNFSNQKLPDW